MKKWKIQSVYSPKEDVLTQILKVRGFNSRQQINEFLNPPSIRFYIDNLDPEFKKALINAKKIVDEAMQRGMPIVIHGDYDADGISSTAVLFNAFKDELHYDNTFSFIPSRFEHGYGLSKNSIDSVVKMLKDLGAPLKKGVLFITVDSGITAVEEIKYIKELGYSVIITDHHQKPEKLPQADLIVWSDKVVGAGVAWILSRVLGSKSTQDISLAALATVTDLQPVININRAIVKKGLEVINDNPPLGLRYILEVAGKNGYEVSAYDLGWVVGPRINASGRLVEASDSLKLFIEKDENILRETAQRLNEVNTLRQDKTLEMFEMALGVDEQASPKIIFSVDQNYHEGIIGLVAAKLVQKYYRPAVVISLSDGFGKGSVRSISGIDIIAILRNFEHLFESLGGHPMAAGFSIEKSNIEVLKSELEKYFEDNYKDEDFVKEINIDMEIPAEIIGAELLEKIEKMKPFGLGNEEPVFALKNVGVFSADTVGSAKQHLSLKLFEKGNYYKAIFFNNGNLLSEIKTGGKVDIAFTLKKNEYNGKSSVDLIVKDIICN